MLHRLKLCVMSQLGHQPIIFYLWANFHTGRSNCLSNCLILI